MGQRAMVAAQACFEDEPEATRGCQGHRRERGRVGQSVRCPDPSARPVRCVQVRARTDDASATEGRKNFATSQILPMTESVTVQVSGLTIDSQRCSPRRARSGGAPAAQIFKISSSTRHTWNSGSYLSYSGRTGSAKSDDVTSLPCRRRISLPGHRRAVLGSRSPEYSSR
jgi:hypothetical protein